MATRGFHTTSWTLIRTASGSPTEDSRAALAALCQKYWRPVYAFVRSRGYNPDESLDLTQAFFALLIEKNYLMEADRSRGRFRSFLLGTVKHFLAIQISESKSFQLRVDAKTVFNHPTPSNPTGLANSESSFSANFVQLIGKGGNCYLPGKAPNQLLNRGLQTSHFDKSRARDKPSRLLHYLLRACRQRMAIATGRASA